MSGAATAAALAVTLGALAWLTATDPKRRRAFRRPPFAARRHGRLAVAAVLLPGTLLLIFGNAVGFVLWLAVAAIGGWAMAAVPPIRARQALDRLAALTPRIRRLGAFAGVVLRPWPAHDDAETAARIGRLEQRVAVLEAALAQPFSTSPPASTQPLKPPRLRTFS